MRHGMTRWLGLTTLLCVCASAQAAETIPVSTQALAEVVIYPEMTAPATVVSDNDSRLSAEVSARIEEVPVRVGDTVPAGTVLIKLDDQDYRLALAQAQAMAQSLEARIDLARYEVQRAQKLSQTQAVSEQLLKQQEANLQSLLAEREAQKAAIALAQRNLQKSTIRAPFNAVITERLAHVGELANPGSPLLRIVDADHVEVAATVQAHLATTLQSASTIHLVNDNHNYVLKLRVITPAIDARSRTREARLTFSGAAALPGSAGEVHWTHPQGHIPAEFLLRRDGKLGVFVIRQNAEGRVARFIEFPHAEEGRPALNTLPTDTLIAVQGRFRLQDGDAVQIQ